ncbi:zinc-binding alcohol dehydrogenase family protein [Streptomyces sp. NPDC051940]|uniref:quinone oxidoreductase family protein n=1 Tax=Streptomyces sp. NPDC051940 TaxID=3155675 RepID=UPI0034411BFF
MRAAVLHKLGETPRYETFPEPVAGQGEAVVEVLAAALKPIDRWMADGSHYAAYREFPVVAGADGVGRLDDGRRVVFFAPVRPYGGMAERALVRAGLWVPVPDEVDDVTAAAVANPGMAAWKSLVWRGGLRPGQTVLVLGATGASGRIAVQLAKRHGAGHVIAAGRNEAVLAELRSLGADEVLRLDVPAPELVEAFSASAAAHPYDLVLDYVWGAPAQALFQALTSPDLFPSDDRERILHVQVGQVAGDAISLNANTLRSTPLEIVGSGTGTSPSPAEAMSAFGALLTDAGSGAIRIATEARPLSDVGAAWGEGSGGARVVFVP